MSIIQSVKAWGIRATDALNKINDPFDDFTRPAFPKDTRALHLLEQDFFADLVSNFWGCDGRVLLHRIPLDNRLGLDTGDQAIWHGIFTAMLALRYHANAQTYDVTRYPSADQTYAHLIQAAKGLQLHQTVPGEAKPRLVRGFTDDCSTFQDDASNDSATGHLLGIYFGWKFGPATMQPVFAQLAAGLAAELHNHEDNLVGPFGAPTTYGALVQGWKTDPLRISLALAIYAVGATLTGEKTFIQDYERLFRGYKALIPYPKVKLWWIDNANDTHRAAIHLAILADLTQGDAHLRAMLGLQRIRSMEQKTGNIWVNALCAFGCEANRADDRAQAMKVLSEFTLAAKRENPGVANWPRLPIFGSGANTWVPRAVLWNNKRMASQPIPRYASRAQDFFWQRNLRSLDEGSGGIPADSRMNCGDWLCAYWLSRATGVITPND